MKRNDPRLVVPLAVVSFVSGVLAWRDLAGRPDDRVRGPRRLWKTLILLNPGNSIAYWVAGRR